VAVTLRAACSDDGAFLAQMLVQAAFWRPDQAPAGAVDVLADPVLAHYVQGWPRPTDVGVIAEASEPVGAAWIRLFRSDDPGYGFVDESTPELTIGVLPGHRRQGIGRQLLEHLAAQARVAGHVRLSLSVEHDNQALQLYRRVGFQEVGRSANSLTMVRHL
jgi:GNAT superfamily N-acetyltransferase